MNLKAKLIAAGLASVVALIIVIASWKGVVGFNDDQNWQVLQSVGGTVTIIDGPGYYGKWFGTVWTYPRTLEAFYSAHPDENDGSKRDESIRVTFNDAGNAQVSSYVRVQLPTTMEQRRQLHRDFQGDKRNLKAAIRAHLVNAIKASGPIMSASENQASRKAEFNLIVEEQLARGLFEMRGTNVELADLTETEVGVDAQGNQVTTEKKASVRATEVVNGADGKPVIIQPSPLLHYGVQVLQFSITDIDYDQQTLAQFMAKKESYLNAEKSKAQRQEEVQQRLMIQEKGLRQIAEIEAEENQKKARALIQAQQAQEVAEWTKKQAVTVAQQRVEVAAQSQKEAATLKSIAQIDSETAELKKKSAISVAEGKQKEIELGGGLSEKDRILAEIKAERDAKVAVALSQVQVPRVVIGGGTGGGNTTADLLNLYLLKSTGIIEEPAAK